MTPSSRALGLCLSAVLAVAACDVKVGDKGVSVGMSGGKATDQWTRSYTVGANGRLEIVNTSGSIEVSGGEGSQVYVQVDREAHASSDAAAREALQTLEIIEEAGSGQVKVETRADQPSSAGLRSRSQLSARYTVRIPPGLTASFRTENGPVTLENLQGRFTATTTNGPIRGTGVSGAVSATTVNGPVQLELRSVSDAMDIVVVNGGIRLQLARDIKADLVASAVNGGVSVDPQLKLASEGGDGARGLPFSNRVTGRLNGGGPKISAQTTNGGIRIMAPGARPRPREDAD